MFKLARLKPVCIAVAALLFGSLVAAQGETFRTGSIEALVDGQSYSAYTYATAVPDNVADGVTDEQQRAILERVAGTTQHSATFMHQDAMVMASIVLAPETIYVTLSTRTDHPEGDSVGSFLVKFSLDPETLELREEADVEVTFYPPGSSYDNYYALTDGVLQLTSLEVLDSQTMAISGVISGLLSLQSGYAIEHNPDDVLSIEATFNIEQVATSSLAFELVTGE